MTYAVSKWYGWISVIRPLPTPAASPSRSPPPNASWSGCSRYVQPGYGVLSVGQDVTDLVAGEVEVLREEADDALTVQLRQAPLPVPFAALATVTDGPVVVDDLKDLRADRVRTWNDLQVGLILGN
jgi:hypothetical protein